jgi:hypothetical protein
VSAELPLGISCDVHPDVYHRRTLGDVSKSGLDQLHRSPAHYKAWVDGRLERDTAALTFGRAFHCALLEPERFSAEYVAEPDFGDCRFKESKRARDEWRAENAGKTAIDSESHGVLRSMVDSVRLHPFAGKMICDGRPEVSLSWVDQETGLRCRSRTDYWVESLGMVVDAKTTEDASPDGFRRSVAKYDYASQDALYRSGFEAVGKHISHFVLVAVEKTAPFAVGVYCLDAEAIGKGYTRVRRGIDLLSECVRKNEWPAYGDRIQQLSLPNWY